MLLLAHQTKLIPVYNFQSLILKTKLFFVSIMHAFGCSSTLIMHVLGCSSTLLISVCFICFDPEKKVSFYFLMGTFSWIASDRNPCKFL